MTGARVAAGWRARAPGKVNLCLLLGGVREDGLHELVSLVESVSLADDLELAPGAAGALADQVLCPGVEGENLAARALAAWRERSGWRAPPHLLRIVKRVPVAAGMGGGSSDAAAALRLVAHAAGRPGDPLLELIAPGLGADVPAALWPGTALVTGAGEHVRPLPALAPHGLLVLPGPGPLSTPAVYREADRLGLSRGAADLAARREELEAALAAPGPLPGELLVNDLERAARSLCPAIDRALAAARDAGARRAVVSGSGATVVGIFPGEDGARRAATAAGALAAGFPGAVAAVPVGEAFGAVAPLPGPAAP